MLVQLIGKRSLLLDGKRLRRFAIADLPKQLVKRYPRGMFERDPEKFKTHLRANGKVFKIDKKEEISRPRSIILTMEMKREDRIKEMEHVRTSDLSNRGTTEPKVDGVTSPEPVSVEESHGDKSRNSRDTNDTRSRLRKNP